MISKKLSLIILVTLIISAGCDNVDLYDFASDPPSDSSAKSITYFSINGIRGTIDEDARTITVEVSSGTSLYSLVPVFLVDGFYVDYEGMHVNSGLSTIDFSAAVVLTVYAYDGTSQDYTVNVTVAEAEMDYILVSSSETSISNNVSMQLSAFLYYTDSSYVDVTSSATWSSGDTSIATVDTSGWLVSDPTNTGDVIITAEYSGISGTITITVSP